MSKESTVFSKEHARLINFASFLEAFKEPQSSFGTWTDARQTDRGLMLPIFLTSKTADEFVSLCYEDKWVLPGFAWVDWSATEEARELRNDPNALAKASERQIEQLLTVIIRQERFAQGTLADAYHSGLIIGILRRVKAIAELT